MSQAQLRRFPGTKANAGHRPADGDPVPEDAARETAPSHAMPIAAPLLVGRVDDPAETAADQMADAVLERLIPMDAESGQSGPAVARRSPGGLASGPIGAAGGQLDSLSGRDIERARGGGRPLPAPVLERMETGFGRSFAGVRIHDDDRAATLAQKMTARAFTTGSDIFLGGGAARPTEPGGERLIAHELAHVVQGGTTAHRDPDKDLEKEKKKEAKAEKKQKKADQKLQDKLANKQTLQTVKESKTALTTEKGRQEGERKIGKEMRKELSAEVSEVTSANGQVDPTGNGRKLELDRDFEFNLEHEQKLFDRYVAAAMSPEDAADKAYDEAWMKCPDPALRAVRPPRETEAERLVRDVRGARTDANVRGSMDEQAERGKLLPKAVEELYEEFEAKIAAEVKAGKTKVQAEAVAQFDVWAKADAKLLAKRPKPGSGTDIKAREEARLRLKLMPDHEKKENGLDGAVEKGEKAEKHFGKAELVLNTVAMAATIGGAGKTKSMRESEGEDKGYDDKEMLHQGLAEPDGGETFIPIIGAPIKAIEQAQMQNKAGVKKVLPGEVPTSTASKVGEGFSVVTEMMSGLLNGVNGAIKFAQAVQKAHSTKNPRDIVAATKIGADALGSFNASAKSTAGFAQLLNPDITVSVAHVVPGLDILAASLQIVSATMGMVEGAMRVQDTQVALNEAHAAKSGNAPNVLVYPLLRVEQSYVKKLEQSVWSTVKAVSDLAASIAQIASAGGYGIPAAYKGATNVLTLLHSLGHIVADDVLTLLAKQSQQASLVSLEGAAENQLQRDPAMAVDGIVMSAVKGNKTAQGFLANYAVDNKPIDVAMLAKLNGDIKNVGNEKLFTDIRGAVLSSMGNDADPTYTYEKYKKSIGDVLGGAKKLTIDKFADTGELGKGRNALDGGDRGTGWRLKMMFKSEHKISRAKNRLTAETKHGATKQLDAGIDCICGGVKLKASASWEDQQAFAKKLDAMDDSVILTAANDPANPDDWQGFFFQLLRDRIMAKATADSKA